MKSSSSSSLAALRERFAARAFRLGALRFDRFGFGVLRFGCARRRGAGGEGGSAGAGAAARACSAS